MLIRVFARERCKRSRLSNAAAQRLLLIAMPDTLSSQLRGVCPPRRNLHIHNLPLTPPANKECSVVLRRKHRHRHRHQGTPQAFARPANDLHGTLKVHLHPHHGSTPRRLQAKHTSACVRDQQAHTNSLILRPPSPSLSRIIAQVMAVAGRNSVNS